MAATFTFARDLEPIIVTGGVAAVVASVLTVVWVAIMALLPSPAAGSTTDEDLAFIAAHDGAQIARFLPTTLLAIAYVPIWVALAVLLWDGAPAAAALAVAFGILYPAITANGYWMQYTVVRGLADLAEDDVATARSAYEVTGFHERPTSMSASAVILGYTVWSCGGLAAGIGLVMHGGRLAVTTGVLYLVTAALMFVGASAYVARNRTLTMGVFLSGLTSLGAVIATAILLISSV